MCWNLNHGNLIGKMGQTVIYVILIIAVFPSTAISRPSKEQKIPASGSRKWKGAQNEKIDIYEDEAKDLSSVNISREHLAEMREIAIAGLRVLSKGQVEAKLEQWAEKAGIKEEFHHYMSNVHLKNIQRYYYAKENLIGSALETFKALWRIEHDNSLTQKEECDAFQSVLRDLSEPLLQLMPLELKHFSYDICMEPRYIVKEAGCSCDDDCTGEDIDYSTSTESASAITATDEYTRVAKEDSIGPTVNVDRPTPEARTIAIELIPCNNQTCGSIDCPCEVNDILDY